MKYTIQEIIMNYLKENGFNSIFTNNVRAKEEIISLCQLILDENQKLDLWDEKTDKSVKEILNILINSSFFDISNKDNLLYDCEKTTHIMPYIKKTNDKEKQVEDEKKVKTLERINLRAYENEKFIKIQKKVLYNKEGDKNKIRHMYLVSIYNKDGIEIGREYTINTDYYDVTEKDKFTLKPNDCDTRITIIRTEDIVTQNIKIVQKRKNSDKPPYELNYNEYISEENKDSIASLTFTNSIWRLIRSYLEDCDKTEKDIDKNEVLNMIEKNGIEIVELGQEPNAQKIMQIIQNVNNKYKKPLEKMAENKEFSQAQKGQQENS